MSGGHEVVRVAERALLVRFLDDDLARAVSRAHLFLERPGDERQKLSVKGEWVLGAGNLLLRLEPSVAPGEVDEIGRQLEARAADVPGDETPSRPEILDLAVDFSAEAAPDLPAVAAETGLAESEVVARLCAATLTVAFIGFSPGFPYLIGLPPELEVPRLSSPRARVAAGSVAIAGPFAGIYPAPTAGGWRLLGRTELSLFDAAAEEPARFAPGDRVRFVAR